MLYSPKCTRDIISKIIFHLSISTNISFYYFYFFLENLGALIWLILIFFLIKDRNTILLPSDLYYSNFCIVCYGERERERIITFFLEENMGQITKLYKRRWVEEYSKENV